MTISHNGNLIKKIYHNGHYIKEVYHGNSLVWKNNTETNLFILNNGYDATGVFLGSLDNNITGQYQLGHEVTLHTAIMPCQPNTTYRISMYVQDRCKIGSHNIIPSIDSTKLNKFFVPTYGNTTGHNTQEIIEYTTGPLDNYLFIYYWNATIGDFHVCYDTINIIEKPNLFILNNGYDAHSTFLGYVSPNIFNSYYTGDWGDLTRTAIMPCQPNTTYRISVFVNKRLRLSSHNIIPSISPNPVSTDMNTSLITAYQSTGTYSKYAVLEYTTGPLDNYLFIYYWADADGTNHEISYDSINITK